MPAASPPTKPLRQPLRARCEVKLCDRAGVLRVYRPSAAVPDPELPVMPDEMARQLVALHAAFEPEPEESDACTQQAPER